MCSKMTQAGLIRLVSYKKFKKWYSFFEVMPSSVSSLAIVFWVNFPTSSKSCLSLRYPLIISTNSSWVLMYTSVRSRLTRWPIIFGHSFISEINSLDFDRKNPAHCQYSMIPGFSHMSKSYRSREPTGWEQNYSKLRNADPKPVTRNYIRVRREAKADA